MIKQGLAGLALMAAVATAIPAAPALADGAASTRNIILGGAAATYLIIQHNRKVHEKYAEYDRRQAQLSQENSDAWAAYHQEQAAYQQEVAINAELKKEIAYQHGVIVQQRDRIAERSGHRTVAKAPSNRTRGNRVADNRPSAHAASSRRSVRAVQRRVAAASPASHASNRATAATHRDTPLSVTWGKL